MRRLTGLSSRRVAAQASAAAGMISGAARKVTRVSGRFAGAGLGIDANPVRADYRAALEVKGGMEPRDLPWLASERALAGDFDVDCQRVGFVLDFAMDIPPALLRLNLHACQDDSLAPASEQATLKVGAAEVPLPLYLPPGLRTEDLASAFEVLMPMIEKAALDLWISSEGGTREVF
jgi:hypothetical protein